MPKPTDSDRPPYAADLARLERTLSQAAPAPDPELPSGAAEANPTLSVVRVGWRGLPELLAPGASSAPSPTPGEQLVLVWRPPGEEPRVKAADPEDLLALKIVVEGIRPEEAAREGGVPVGRIEAILGRAQDEGLVLAPTPLLRRDPRQLGVEPHGWKEFLVAPVFTLQWHLTQACDLRCRHCYDRSPRDVLPHDRALRVLDDLHWFCRERRVRGHVTFTGGNPLLHPRFLDLYREAADRGFGLTVLGNPSPRDSIEALCAIRPPEVFQVSLEGLKEHNDAIRGPGHFERTLEFLGLLRRLGVFSMVMLTLTRDNVDQVLPLAERLRPRADRFHFNRLSPVGEGANLPVVPRERYRAFLEDYLVAARENPVLGLKDNLLNPLRYQRGEPVFGGCTGFGCGAAFNFVCLLPDGEVHACRKFPSPIGTLRVQSLAEIYDSPRAARYRAGPSACRGCPVRPVCGGCLASTSGFGLDTFEARDPYCAGRPQTRS